MALAAERRPSLIVTVDNGVSSIEGVEAAHALGIPVLITDHHLPGARLPSADAIVNPNLAGSGFASPALSGVGVAVYVVAAILLHLGNSRRERRLMIAGGVVAGLLAVWILAAALVVTPAERLANAHQALATAAEKGDVAGILAWFTPEFQSAALQIEDPQRAKDEIQRRLKDYGIKTVHLKNYHSEMNANHGTTQVTVDVQAAQPSVPTTWRLLWEDVPGADWRISEADLVKIAGQNAPPGFVLGR